MKALKEGSIPLTLLSLADSFWNRLPALQICQTSESVWGEWVVIQYNEMAQYRPYD